MTQRDEFLRTIGYGEAAVAQLRRNENAAYPRNYELWYNYCAGFNHALNRAVILHLEARVDQGRDSGDHRPVRVGERVEKTD